MRAVCAVLVALAVGALTGCGHTPPVGPNPGSAGMPEPLNTVSASDVVGAIAKAGLPVANQHDVTAQQCPKLHCAQALETDTVSVFKFPATGLAQKYAGDISSVYQVEDLVLVFAPSVTADSKQDYEKVVARLAA